jgi:hypothetical protein
MKPTLRVLGFIFFSCTFVRAQTIADLARQARARLQSGQKAVVITTQDLKTGSSTTTAEEKPAVEASTAEPSSTAAAQPPASPAAPAGPGGHDEKWWRGQFDKVREDIQRLETQTPLLEADVNTANREFLTRSYDPDGRGKRAIDESKARLEQAKSDLAKARNRLTQLEDDLRSAGGPAGWAR